MYLPQLRAGARKIQKQEIQFGGLNRTRAVNEGELADAVGISPRLWPCLTNRSGQILHRPTQEATDLFAWGKLISVEGSRLCYDGETVGAVTPGKKQFAVVNTKLCIFPDKKYLDLTTREFGDLGASVTLAPSTAVFDQRSIRTTRLHSAVGQRYRCCSMTFYSEDETLIRAKRYSEANIAWSAADGWSLSGGEEVRLGSLKPGDCVMLPKASVRGDRWLDYSYPRAKNPTQYAEEYDAWGDYAYILECSCSVGVETGRIEIYAERRNAGAANTSLKSRGFKPGDVVTVSGCVTQEGNNVSAKIQSVEDKEIVFDAPCFTACEEAGEVRIQRQIPDLDLICENGNRLWGVCNADQTIYASALGDPQNFNDYSGLDTDSYAVAVGTDGAFTACVAYGSNVLCWKENCLHKLLGTLPRNYELFTYQIAGVQAGSEKSLQTVNETLYYKGREGVYVYTGGTPRLISGKLGLVDYTEAVGGHDGRSYYVSMKRSDNGEWETLTYSIETGLWSKEDNVQALAFANLSGALYMLTQQGIVRKEGETDDGGPIPWELTFSPFQETPHNKKGYSRLLLRLELMEGAWAEVETSLDGRPFRPVWTASTPGRLTRVIPIRPGRCDSFQVRLRGRGGFLLSSMAREFTVGSVW